jgi:hypothetical protein
MWSLRKKYIICVGAVFVAMLMISSATALQHIHGSYVIKAVKSKQQSIITGIKQAEFSIEELMDIASKIISTLKEKYGRDYLIKLEDKARQIINSKNLFNKLPSSFRMLMRELKYHRFTAVNSVLDGPQPCQYLLMMIIASIVIVIFFPELIPFVMSVWIVLGILVFITWWISRQSSYPLI